MSERRTRQRWNWRRSRSWSCCGACSLSSCRRSFRLPDSGAAGTLGTCYGSRGSRRSRTKSNRWTALPSTCAPWPAGRSPKSIRPIIVKPLQRILIDARVSVVRPDFFKAIRPVSVKQVRDQLDCAQPSSSIHLNGMTFVCCDFPRTSGSDELKKKIINASSQFYLDKHIYLNFNEWHFTLQPSQAHTP